MVFTAADVANSMPAKASSLLTSRSMMAAKLSAVTVHQPTSSGLTWVTLVTGGERPHVLIKHLQTVYL